MTLITFQSRIHFATDVLEEALRAELEESGHDRVLVIHDDAQSHHQLLERVHIAMPDNVSRETLTIVPGNTKVQTANLGLGYDEIDPFDVIIACGSSRAIAIPGVDGLPDPCLSGGSTANIKTSPPNVIICDPSVITESSEVDIANAFATTLGRCLGTFAGSNFNPLADGMAAEGLWRLAKILPQVYANNTGSFVLRDLMAASLNGSISQQKGPRLVEAIANALTLLTQNDVDTGSLQRILLPRLLHDLQLVSRNDEALILRLLDADEDATLSKSVEDILDPLPLNRTLSDMGYSLSDVQRAISTAEDRIQLSSPIAQQIQTIVEDVF